MDVPPGFIVSIIREAAAESYRKMLTFDKFHISLKNRRRSVDSRAACVVYCTENLYVKGVARMKKTYLGLMGLFLLPQTALAVDAAAPASTSVSSPLAALWRVLLTPITVPHLPWQLPLLAPVALVLVLLLLIFCLLARRGGYRRGFREGERAAHAPPSGPAAARRPEACSAAGEGSHAPACGGEKARPSGSRKAGISRPGNTGPRRSGLSGGEAGRAGHRSAVGGDQADVAHFFRKPNNPFFS